MKPYARALFLSNTAAERVDRFELCHQRRDIAKFRSRSHDALIRVYDESGNMIETPEHTGDFKQW